MSKTITMSFAAAKRYAPPHPSRTARRNSYGLNFDVTFREWPNRQSMLTTLAMQDRAHREHRLIDWCECPSVYDPGSMQLRPFSYRAALVGLPTTK